MSTIPYTLKYNCMGEWARQQSLFKLRDTYVAYGVRGSKRNSAPAADGITAEHLVHEADSDIIRHIADMLTLWVQFGVVPDNFTNGTLVLIPKTPGCDTSIPKKWRPIVISTTLSKLLEMYVFSRKVTAMNTMSYTLDSFPVEVLR